MKSPFPKVINMDEVKKGLVNIYFIPYMRQKSASGAIIEIEIANLNSGSLLHLVSKDSDGDIINSSFQYVPGLYGLTVDRGLECYDEVWGDAKGYRSLIDDKDVEFFDVDENTEPAPQQESDEDHLDKLFEDTEEDTEEEDDEDENAVKDPILESIEPEADDEPEEAEEEEPAKEEINEDELLRNFPEEIPDEETRSLEEIQAIVNKKKAKRSNIEYVGVDAPLPSEGAPKNNPFAEMEEQLREKVDEVKESKPIITNAQPNPKQESRKQWEKKQERKKSKYEKRQEYDNRGKKNHDKKPHKSERADRFDPVNFRSLMGNIASMYER